MAGMTGLGLHGLLLGEGVAGMAGVTSPSFITDPMATGATCFNHFSGLPGGEGHGGHGSPCQRMFSGLKLLGLFGMAGFAGIGVWHPHLFIVRAIPMVGAVALGTFDLSLSHDAFEILLDQDGIALLMTIGAGIGLLAECRQSDTEGEQDYPEDRIKPASFHSFTSSKLNPPVAKNFLTGPGRPVRKGFRAVPFDDSVINFGSFPGIHPRWI